ILSDILSKTTSKAYAKFQIAPDIETNLLPCSRSHRIVFILQSNRYELRHAIVLHCNSIQHIRFHHRPLAMCHDNELRILGELTQVFRETRYIGIIKRSFNFIQYTERNRLDSQNRE